MDPVVLWKVLTSPQTLGHGHQDGNQRPKSRKCLVKPQKFTQSLSKLSKCSKNHNFKHVTTSNKHSLVIDYCALLKQKMDGEKGDLKCCCIPSSFVFSILNSITTSFHSQNIFSELNDVSISFILFTYNFLEMRALGSVIWRTRR